MTALKPSANLRVEGVPSTKYPTNRICAMPECGEPAESVHHCYPRSLIGNDSYFVRITEDGENGHEHKIIPHAVGLCGSGTTGHHGDVEEHRAWIKLEDGEFVWYDRVPFVRERLWRGGEEFDDEEHEWERLGPLNPQPGSREGKPKRKRTQKGSAERKARQTVTFRLPEDVDGEYWDDLVDEAEAVELAQSDTKFDAKRGSVTKGKLFVAILERFTGRAG